MLNKGTYFGIALGEKEASFKLTVSETADNFFRAERDFNIDGESELGREMEATVKEAKALFGKVKKTGIGGIGSMF